MITYDPPTQPTTSGQPSGLSEAKAKALQDLAAHFADPNRLKEVDFTSLDVAELTQRLVAIRGLGPWSVDMFLMFSMCKADIMPVGDLAVRKRVLLMNGVTAKTGGGGGGSGKSSSINVKEAERRCKELTAHWSPFRSVGAMYMWKLADAEKLAAGKK